MFGYNSNTSLWIAVYNISERNFFKCIKVNKSWTGYLDQLPSANTISLSLSLSSSLLPVVSVDLSVHWLPEYAGVGVPE